MVKAIIGKKAGMTQIFDENGRVVPVTVIEAGPCVVTQKKVPEKDGYSAVQFGFSETEEKRLTKPESGHLKKAGVEPVRVLKEFKLDDPDALNVGDTIYADVFEEGDKVDVTGTSKGKGFSGVVKRHGARRTPMSHGGGPVHRHAGAMAAAAYPGRIFKGKIGAGQMGAEQVTVQNLEIVKVDKDMNLIAVRGAVPGSRGSMVFIKSTVKTD